MKRAFARCTIALLLASGIFAEEKEEKIALKDMPPAAQKAVQDLIKGAKLQGLSKEEENGKTVYEIETIKNGKKRDVLIDAAGAILEIEEGTTLYEIPGPAKAAIEKAATGGRVTRVETVTIGGVTDYEAAITKAGNNSEIKVKADGSIIK
jgi:uncharacterized membrane protein YkoI